jgi:hypothetical protein
MWEGACSRWRPGSPPGCWSLIEYISVIWVTAAIGSALMYGLASTVYPLFNTATRLHLCIRPIRGSPSLASGQHWLSSRYADYVQASKAGKGAGIDPRRSDLGSMFSSRGWSALRPGGRTLVICNLSQPAGLRLVGCDKSGHSVAAPR